MPERPTIVGGVPMLHSPFRIRRWRRRGRKGQVAAVATILGLLLVVVFIANYLTTTLPSQMSVNDLDHELQVENQLGRFQALLEQVSRVGAIGAEVTQPVALGSQGLPPFASADSGAIGPLDGANYSFAYPLAGSGSLLPPTGGTPGGYLAGCGLTNTPALVRMVCTSPASVTYNFTGVPTEGFDLEVDDGGTFALTVSTNGSQAAPEPIDLTVRDAQPADLTVLGSNDSIALTISAVSSVDLVVHGSNDTLAISNSPSGSGVGVYVVGHEDSVAISEAIGLELQAYLFGWGDAVAMTDNGRAASSSTEVAVQFVGFTHSTTACPNGILAMSDSVSGSNREGTYSAKYNGTEPFTPTHVQDWQQSVTVKPSPSPRSCPFYTVVPIPIATGPRSAALNLKLQNSYAPPADLAFEAGAVVYAQTGGVPVLLDPPALSVLDGKSGVTSVSLWVPVLIGSTGSESGILTSVLTARLVRLSNVVLNATSPDQLGPRSTIVFSVTSPFAVGWWSYFNATYPKSWSSCAGNGCSGLFSGLGEEGTVSLAIPTGSGLTAFHLEIATFSFDVT